MSGDDIELIVLDAHGVVLNSPLPAFLALVAERTGQVPAALHAVWHQELRNPAWTGRIGDTELWARLAGPEHYRHDWRSELEAAYALGPAAPYLSVWREHAPLWILSNHRSHWLEPRLRRFEVRDAFARVLVSDGIGATKPDEAAFAPVLAHVRRPSAVLLLDDRRRNVEAARRLGMRAVQVDAAGSWRAAVAGLGTLQAKT